jgi:hypothetical protein
MTWHEKVVNTLVLVAIGKCFSEQSTYLTGELNQRPKQAFNLAVKSIDTFINEIEGKLTTDELKVLESLTDDFHELLNDIRKQIKHEDVV